MLGLHLGQDCHQIHVEVWHLAELVQLLVNLLLHGVVRRRPKLKQLGNLRKAHCFSLPLHLLLRCAFGGM